MAALPYIDLEDEVLTRRLPTATQARDLFDAYRALYYKFHVRALADPRRRDSEQRSMTSFCIDFERVMRPMLDRLRPALLAWSGDPVAVSRECRVVGLFEGARVGKLCERMADHAERWRDYCGPTTLSLYIHARRYDNDLLAAGIHVSFLASHAYATRRFPPLTPNVRAYLAQHRLPVVL